MPDTTFCPYCNCLKRAIEDHNYCSNTGDDIQSVKSNAFYMATNQMYSGKHVSRLSIRSVLNGYQYYKTGRQDRTIKKDNYLIINEGQTWYSEINAEEPVELLVVAFHPEILRKALYSLTASSRKLIDDPFFPISEGVHFFENTYSDNQEIKQLFLQIKTAINTREKDELYFEELEFSLLTLVFQKHQSLLEESLLLPSRNRTTQKEILFRLGLAKDFMLSNLDKKIGLNDISKAAALSPYHFLRLFKTLYGITPHQFLTLERMNLAKYLLQKSSKSIREVSFSTGYENHSSFGRVFKNYFGISPHQIRTS